MEQISKQLKKSLKAFWAVLARFQQILNPYSGSKFQTCFRKWSSYLRKLVIYMRLPDRAHLKAVKESFKAVLGCLGAFSQQVQTCFRKLTSDCIQNYQNMISASRSLPQRISVAVWSFLRMTSGADGGFCWVLEPLGTVHGPVLGNYPMQAGLLPIFDLWTRAGTRRVLVAHLRAS